MHVIAGKAVAFKEALQPEFKAYQEQVVKNASVLADSLAAKGFRIVSGGTDNHLMLVDLSGKGVTGKVAEKCLDEAGLTVNKHLIPFDTGSPFVTSGIRVGTPAATTRGMKEEEMKSIADFMDRAIASCDKEEELAAIKGEVVEFLKAFPLYVDWIDEMESA